MWPAYVSLVVGAVCIGCSAIFVRLAGISGWASAFYRVFVAGVVLMPWWLLSRPSLPSRSDLAWILAGGVFFALDLVLWNSSVLLIPAATATLLANNAPAWVGLGALFLFRQSLSVHFWIGLAIAMAGMVVMVGLDAWRQLSFNSGVFLAIGASIVYAAYLLTTERVRSRVDTLTLNALYMASNVILLFVMSLLLKVPLTGYSDKTWLALIGLGLISQLGGWLAINYALGHLRAAPVSVGLLGQPVVTALLAMPVLGEYLNLNQAFGGILILVGIYLVNRQKKQTSDHECTPPSPENCCIPLADLSIIQLLRCRG
jgi:drug/metabolite transporter (DMT)-like permease